MLESAQPESPALKEKAQAKVFIYTLADPRTGEIRYVGKAINIEQRFSGHLKDKKLNHKANWVRVLAKIGLKPRLEIIEETIESDWVECEKFWIENLRFLGFQLTNLTAGGENGVDIRRPGIIERWTASQKAAQTGKKQSPEAIKSRVDAMKEKWGYKFSPESKRKMSESAKHRVYKNQSSKVKQLQNLEHFRTSNANKEINRVKMAARWKTKEWRDKMTALSKSQRHTDETKAKMKANHWRKKQKEVLC